MQVLKQNPYQIERETTQESRAINLFQPFVTELLKNQYATPITIDVVRSLVHRGDVANFLKKQALLLTPSVNSLEITEEAKLNMIDVAKKFSNYFAITSLHATLPKEDKTLRLIYSYNLDNEGKLFLSLEAQARIRDSYTLYATPEEAEAFNTLSSCLETIESYKAKIGFNLFSPGATRPTESGGWEVNAELLLGKLRNRN